MMTTKSKKRTKSMKRASSAKNAAASAKSPKKEAGTSVLNAADPELSKKGILATILDLMTNVRDVAFWDKEPRSMVSKYHKTSFRRFRVSKTTWGAYAITRVK